VVSTAAKRGVASPELLVRTVATMAELNRDAAARAIAAGASAVTDVTGYGLLGHAYELAEAGGVQVELSASAVPAIAGVAELLQADDPPVAGGTRRNREWVEPNVDWAAEVPEWQRWLLCDAMTSGGLLVAAPAGAAEAAGVEIGRIAEGGKPGRVRVRP
jgi:selenide,water dikinase